MSITEQELEAAKVLLREEFKSSLDAALQELSVQIKESHNQVLEAATKGNAEFLAAEVNTLQQANVGFQKGLTEHVEVLLEKQISSPEKPINGLGESAEQLALRVEQHHLYLDDLADRLGQPRMAVS